MINRDAILAELLEIESLLQDDFALHGAQQALRNILEPDTWHQASQTFYRIDNRPIRGESTNITAVTGTRARPLRSAE